MQLLNYSHAFADPLHKPQHLTVLFCRALSLCLQRESHYPNHTLNPASTLSSPFSSSSSVDEEVHFISAFQTQFPRIHFSSIVSLPPFPPPFSHRLTYPPVKMGTRSTWCPRHGSTRVTRRTFRRQMNETL